MTGFDNRHVWTPVAAMPDGAAQWGNPLYRSLAEQWAVIQSKLEDRERERAYLDGWLQERKRAFAIETGQIEGLYTLKRGVTEKFITEGFESAKAAHTVENIADDTLKGLLTDQQDALDMVFDENPPTSTLSKRRIAVTYGRSRTMLETRHKSPFEAASA